MLLGMTSNPLAGRLEGLVKVRDFQFLQGVQPFLLRYIDESDSCSTCLSTEWIPIFHLPNLLSVKNHLARWQNCKLAHHSFFRPIGKIQSL